MQIRRALEDGRQKDRCRREGGRDDAVRRDHIVLDHRVAQREVAGHGGGGRDREAAGVGERGPAEAAEAGARHHLRGYFSWFRCQLFLLRESLPRRSRRGNDDGQGDQIVHGGLPCVSPNFPPKARPKVLPIQTRDGRMGTLRETAALHWSDRLQIRGVGIH